MQCLCYPACLWTNNEVHHGALPCQRASGARCPFAARGPTAPLAHPAIDLPRTIVKTESGRSYHLCNPPEEDQLLRSLIVLNAARGLVHVSGDVSDAIWAAITTGAGPMKAPACCLQCNSSAQAVWTVDLMPWGSSSPLISTMQEIPDGPAFHPTDFICCSQKGADTPLV